MSNKGELFLDMAVSALPSAMTGQRGEM